MGYLLSHCRFSNINSQKCIFNTKDGWVHDEINCCYWTTECGRLYIRARETPFTLLEITVKYSNREYTAQFDKTNTFEDVKSFIESHLEKFHSSIKSM